MGVKRYIADLDPRSYKFYHKLAPFMRFANALFRC
jgi:hypothetical protein